jgi:hypothetical protein
MGLTSLGSDLGGVLDLLPNLGIVSDGDCLLEAVVCRWLTPRGGLWYDDEYGGGLMDLVNATNPDMRRLSARLVDQATLDERVASATVDCQFFVAEQRVEVSGDIVAVTGVEFDFTLSISSLTGALLWLNRG